MGREESHNDLERFFLELAPRLETARVLDRELDRQLARRFNVLDYLRTDELGLSRVVADLLNPEGNHGQGAVFLQLLLDKLGFKVDGKIGSSRVDVELTIKDHRRLDVAVRIDERHCLAIENKPYAADQPDQVKDYLKWLEQYDKRMLIYLSPTGAGPAEHSIGEADLVELRKHDDPRRFAIMPYHPAADLDDGFNDFRLPFSLADWLADCRKSCDVDRLRWFLREAETFCQRQFGGNTMTTAESSIFKDFVLSDSRNAKTAHYIHALWPDLRKQIGERFLKRISCKIEDKMPKGVVCRYSFGGQYKNWVVAYSKDWKAYGTPDPSTGLQQTSIRLQTDANELNEWYISVRSPLRRDHMKSDNRSQCGDTDRRKKLDERILKEIEHENTSESHIWSSEFHIWGRHVEKYRDWEPSLFPKIYRELKLEGEGGEITDYFVNEFVKIANAAIPIINDIEGGKP